MVVGLFGTDNSSSGSSASGSGSGRGNGSRTCSHNGRGSDDLRLAVTHK